jgi:hypothetical protein
LVKLPLKVEKSHKLQKELNEKSEEMFKTIQDINKYMHSFEVLMNQDIRMKNVEDFNFSMCADCIDKKTTTIKKDRTGVSFKKPGRDCRDI